ncbi:hypothetical protein CHUAL_011665 [Chamberlinius hualienensis]
MAVVKLCRNFTLMNDEMADSLIEINNETDDGSTEISKKLEMKMNLIEYNVKKLHVIKYVTYISFIFAFLLFMFLIIIFYANFQWHTNQLKQVQNKLQAMETDYNDTQFTIDELEMRHQHLELKSQMRENASNKYLIKIEELWNELHDVIKTIDKAPHKQFLYSTTRNISEIYLWNVTDILKTKASDVSLHYGNSEFINYGVRWSEVFPIWQRYTAKLKLNVLHYKTLVSMQIIESNDTQNSKKLDGLSSLTYIFKDEREDKMIDVVHTAYCHFNQSIKYNEDMFDVKLYHFRGITTRFNVINGYLLLWLLMEPPEISRTYYSTDGILLWRIDNYKERKLNEDEGRVNFQQSPYFYTHPNGYRMRLHAHLDHIVDVRFSLVFYCGPNDLELPDKFPFRATVTMFNQDDPSRNLFQSEDYFFTGEKESTFIIVSGNAFFIEKSGFVRNNSMILRVIVELLPIDNP